MRPRQMMLGNGATDRWRSPTVVLPSGHLRWSREDIERQLKKIRQRGDDN